MQSVKDRVKEHEGFRDTVYSDSLGFATIGYGHLVLPTDNFVEGVAYPKEQLEALFEKDFEIAETSANELLQGIEHNETVRGIITEMTFQLGKPRVLKFKKMWSALDTEDYGEASFQMMDSLWAKQTPNRAEKLSQKMRSAKT